MAVRTITSIDELKVLAGQELGRGEWLLVTQERINAFADATNDHQWIHVDVDRAKAGPFGETIAHGFLTLSLSLGLQDSLDTRVDIPAKMHINYGLNRVRFPSPVRTGKRLRAASKLVSVDEVGPNAYQVATEITIEIEGEAKPAMVAEHLTRLYL